MDLPLPPDNWTAVRGAASASPASGPWAVYIDDNFHCMDEEARTARGRYATLDEAVAVCMEITRASVTEHEPAGGDAEGGGGGGGGYVLFGEDPWISPRPSPEELTALLARHPDWPPAAFAPGFFSARLYAAVLRAGYGSAS
jgi:hypothetical protein